MVLIVIEGIDGAGKSTQAALLAKRLHSLGYEAIGAREPTDGPVGIFLRNALSGSIKLNLLTMQLLFVADRNEDIAALSGSIARKVVILDRYYYSTIAYGSIEGIDKRYLETLNSIFPRPDKTFMLEISPREALERLSKSRHTPEVLENRRALEAAAKAYKGFSGPEIERIDASAEPELISNMLLSKTLDMLKSAGVRRKRLNSD